MSWKAGAACAATKRELERMRQAMGWKGQRGVTTGFTVVMA